MVGRRVFLTNREFTLDELYKFMEEHWDVNEAGRFTKGKPTVASIEEYILLPATERFVTIVYPRKTGWLFSKENKVILSTADTPKGAWDAIGHSIPTGNIFIGIAQLRNLGSYEEERKGPAEDVRECYAAYMKTILEEAGYLKK